MNRQIKSIRIQDFQNHQDTFFELKPGLNLFTGSSDSGKSAIVRAINLVYFDIFNKYNVRDGQKNAIITITYVNGDWITRIKGDANEIEYQREGEKIVKHSKFGKNIPQDVVDFIGYIPRTSNHPLPLAGQEDKLFLINLTDEAIPKEISRLLGIYDLEEAASLLNSEIIKISGDIKRVAAEIDNTKSKLEPFEDLDEQIKILNELKSLIEKYKSINSEIVEMTNDYTNCLKIVKQYKECEAEKEKSESIFDFLSSNIPIIEKHYNKFSEGNTLIQNIIKTNQKLELIKEKYNMFYAISEGEIGILITKCVDEHLVLDELFNLGTDISELLVKIDEKKQDIDQENLNISNYDKEIKELEQYLKDNFEICEVCGSVK